jgi:tetratricopeptide (TPR) repeat protein
MKDHGGIENNDGLNALAMTGLAVAAAGIWKLFNDSSNSTRANNQQRSKIQEKYNYAVLYAQRNNFSQALKVLFEILAVVPTHAPTYNFVAWIYALHNYQLEQALAFSNRAVELANNSLERLLYVDTLAEIYARKGDFQKAASLSIKFLEELKKINQRPPRPTTYFRLAWYYQLNQDFNNVNIFLQHASEITGWAAGDYALAGDIYKAAASAWFSKGIYREAIVQYENAAIQYQEAIRIASTSGISQDIFLLKLSACLNDKGVILYHQEDYKNSQIIHYQAYQTYSKNPYPIINLAQLAAKNGDRSLVRAWLETCIPLIQDNPVFICADRFITIMLTELDFDAYQRDILDLLFSNGKVHITEYKRLMTNQISRANKANHPINFSQQNFYSPVQGVAGNVEGNFLL